MACLFKPRCRNNMLAERTMAAGRRIGANEISRLNHLYTTMASRKKTHKGWQRSFRQCRQRRVDNRARIDCSQKSSSVRIYGYDSTKPQSHRLLTQFLVPKKLRERYRVHRQGRHRCWTRCYRTSWGRRWCRTAEVSIPFAWS